MQLSDILTVKYEYGLNILNATFAIQSSYYKNNGFTLDYFALHARITELMP